MYKPEAKDSYQYNIRSYQNRVQTKSKPVNSMRRLSCDYNMEPIGGGSRGEEKSSEKKRFRFVTSQINYFKDKFYKRNKGKIKEEDGDLSFDEEDEDLEKEQEIRNRWNAGFDGNGTWANLIQKVMEENKREKEEEKKDSSIFLQDEEVFWQEMDKMCRVVVEDSWRKFMSEMWEDRWRSEDRKEIIGEEWRKISRILDRLVSHYRAIARYVTVVMIFRFLLIMLAFLSIINTIWCIFVSPHINRNYYDLDDDSDLSI